MRSQWKSIPYIGTLFFMILLAIFVSMNFHQIVDGAQINCNILRSDIGDNPTTYTITNFANTSTHGTLTMKVHTPNAAQNPGVDISEEIFVSYFVKPTAFIGTAEQSTTWISVTDSGSTLIAYKGTVKFTIDSSTQLDLRFNQLFVTHVDFELKEGTSNDITNQSTTLDYSPGAVPARNRCTNYLTPSFILEQNSYQIYFPNLPQLNTNEFCIGMIFGGVSWPSFDVRELVDEQFTQNVTPVLLFKSNDSLLAVVCFESEDSTSTLDSIGFTSPLDSNGPSEIQFYEIPRRLAFSFNLNYNLSPFNSFSLTAFDSQPLFKLINISQVAPSFPSTRSRWFQWSLSYKPAAIFNQSGDKVIFLDAFEYFGEFQIHFCRPSDDHILNKDIFWIIHFKFFPSQNAQELRPLITIHCFGTVSPFYRHRNGIDETSTWQKTSQTPFSIQLQGEGAFSNPFVFDKSTLPAINTLPQIVYTTADYQFSFFNSQPVAQHKLVVQVNGYTFATGIEFRIPNVFSVVEARESQTPVADENKYVRMEYYESSKRQPDEFYRYSEYPKIESPLLAFNTVVKCIKAVSVDFTTYTCNPPALYGMIDLSYTMFISRVMDFQNISNYAQAQPSFSVFKYHPSSDYTNPAGPFKVFEVPMSIKIPNSIFVSVPSKTEITLKLTQQSIPVVPTSSTPAVVLPTSHLSIQFSDTFQGSLRQARASYYSVNGSTSTLIAQQTTPQVVTAAAIFTSIPVDKLGDLTSESVIVVMVHYINASPFLETYFFTESFTIQPVSCGEDDDVCKNDGVCGIDGACHCVDNNWDGPFCATCSLKCQNGGTYNVECTQCACVGQFTGDFCETCPLQCQNGGFHNTECTKCVCTDNWDDALCDKSTHCVEPSQTQCYNGGQLTQLTNDVPPNCDLAQPCNCVDDWKGANCACFSECQNGGSCQSDGTCQCLGNWDDKFCNECSLKCQNGGSVNTECTECNCIDPWTGENCACSLECENGGTPNAACTKCDCVGELFIGDLCATCSLQCKNSGSVNTECTKCDCVGGFTGDLCEFVVSEDENVNNAMPFNFVFALSIFILFLSLLFFN